MTFRQFLALVRARWVTVAVVLAAIVGATIFVSSLLTRQYTGEASVVIDFKPDPISAAMLGGAAGTAFMATQVDILNSDRVARRVVRNLKLTAVPELRQQWLDATEGNGDFELWVQKAIQKNMDVVPSRVSSVITIDYRAPDPRFAAAVANEFMRAYIDTTLELRVDPARRYSAFFDTRAKDARDALEKAQSRLSAFQNEKGISASDERMDVENARLAELSTQMTMLQALASDYGSRNVAATGALGDRTQEVLNNPLLSQLKAEIARTEARLQELNTRYGENHPQVVEAKANLAEMRSKLDAETRRVTGGVGVSNTITRQRETQAKADLEVQRAKVLRMKAVRDEGMVLVRDMEQAQRAYDAISQRLTLTSLESQTTQSNVNVLTEAVPPNDASSPRMRLNVLLAIVAGLLLGIGAAVIRELRDRRVRSAGDVSMALGLPVIGVMPKPRSKLALHTSKLSPMQNRLMAMLPNAGKGA